MTTKQAILHFGSKTALAQALGISRQAVQQWGKRPPLLRQYHIEWVTEGELRVDEVGP